jgi:GNAT superfamily N-acetyltransferase
MNYRLASEQDAQALAEMRWDFRTETVERPPSLARGEFVAACAEFFRRALSEGRWACWLAEDDGQIIANIFIQRVRKIPNPYRLHGEFGYLTNVYTRPPFRGHGVGTALLDRVKEWAKSQDLELLILWPSDTSIAFYKRAGFAAEHEMLQCRVRGDIQ